MTERLTEFVTKNCSKPFYRFNENSHISIRYRYCNNIDKAINKLGRLEDIMEKYGIESVEELDKKIGHYIDNIDLEAENDYLKKAIEKQNIVTQSISKDRDTWQRACELACDAMTKLGGDDCCGCRLNKEMCKICENKKGLIDYFYQQAKKEKEEQNNDTNQ